MYQKNVDARGMQFKPKKDEGERQKKDGGGGMLGGMLGGIMSDKRSKEEIQRLEGANEALSKALSSKAEYPDTRQPSSGMQALGQQTTPPAHASFPAAPQLSPAAASVAAGNRAMAPMVQQPQAPQQAPAAQPGTGPFAVNLQRPDLSQLDEAYRRQGRGG